MPKQALVLVDVIGHGLKAGQILDATPALIAALGKEGAVDDNKEALAYARSQGAPVVKSAIEAAAAARADAEQALRVEIAQLTDLHAKAADGPDKDALAATLAAKTNQLTALGA